MSSIMIILMSFLTNYLKKNKSIFFNLGDLNITLLNHDTHPPINEFQDSL